MNRHFRKSGLAQAVVFLFILSLSSSAPAADLGAARVMPKGTVHIYEGALKIGELSSEAPLPAGKILTSARKCGVRLEGIYLVADENTRFSVTPFSGETDIFVEQGRVYFALAELRDTLSLSTPHETVTVQGAIINASTETSMIRGYLLFEDNRMEIGVIEGGKLVVAKAGAGSAIEAGNSLLVQNAKAALASSGAAASGASGHNPFVVGALAAGAVAGVVVLIAASGSGGDGVPPPVASPFEPN